MTALALLTSAARIASDKQTIHRARTGVAFFTNFMVCLRQVTHVARALPVAELRRMAKRLRRKERRALQRRQLSKTFVASWKREREARTRVWFSRTHCRFRSGRVIPASAFRRCAIADISVLRAGMCGKSYIGPLLEKATYHVPAHRRSRYRRSRCLRQY